VGSLSKYGRAQLSDETHLYSRVEIPLLFHFSPLYLELLICHFISLLGFHSFLHNFFKNYTTLIPILTRLGFECWEQMIFLLFHEPGELLLSFLWFSLFAVSSIIPNSAALVGMISL